MPRLESSHWDSENSYSTTNFSSVTLGLNGGGRTIKERREMEGNKERGTRDK